MDETDRDFSEMIGLLNAYGVDYLLVGAHALGAHGIQRATSDIDFWVRPDAGNAERVLAALHEFGAPLHRITLDDLTEGSHGLHLGVPPGRIDILTAITGVPFDEAWEGRVQAEVFGKLATVLGREELVRNKTATGRTKDAKDVRRLQAEERKRR